MPRVTGIGGIFFKCEDPTAQQAWYQKHLGVPADCQFKWKECDTDKPATTVWAPFAKNTKYFEPSTAPFMINYRVENLDALLELLAAEGVQIDPRREESEYGRFAWIIDPEGNRIELWQPPAEP
jgi:predicted enzyme related to lactoylglutathione lyase